jgi:hypothetical protein
MRQVAVSTAVAKVLEQGARQLKQIEQESFESSLLRKLQGQLTSSERSASQNIAQLASLFKYLDFIINPIMSSILNGLSLFHLHILFRWINGRQKQRRRAQLVNNRRGI